MIPCNSCGDPSNPDLDAEGAAPICSECWLKAIGPIRITPKGHRALELHRSGLDDEQIKEKLAKEGWE